MTVDINETVNRVRMSRGLQPLPDPTRIQGFGPDDPPAPDPQPVPVFENPYPPLTEPQAPLVDRAPEPPPPVPEPERPSLVVWGNKASYQGHEAELSTSEEASVGRVILCAVRRRLREQMKAIAEPRRKKASAAPVEPERRKRGRPRKNP